MLATWGKSWQDRGCCHRRGSKDHSSLVTAIFRWFRSGDCCDVGLPFVSLSTQALFTSKHLCPDIRSCIFMHHGQTAPRYCVSCVSRGVTTNFAHRDESCPRRWPQVTGKFRFNCRNVVALPGNSTKVRRIKSPLPNTFYIQFCKGRKALVPEDARGPRARQGGGFVGKHRNRERSSPSSDHSLFLSGFGSPLQRFDQASLDLNIHRSLKIQVPGVLHRWPRCCVVHLVHLTPKRQLNFPICLFDIVNLNEFAICEFQLVAQLLTTMGVLEGDFNFLSRWAAAPWSRWDKDWLR